MTYVLDASAMIALLRGETGGDLVRRLVLDPANECFAHSLSLCEVYYDFHRAAGVESADAAIDSLLAAEIYFSADMDIRFWKEAGILKADWKRISLADCFAVSLARRLEAELVTADRHELEPLQTAVGLIFIR